MKISHFSEVVLEALTDLVSSGRTDFQEIIHHFIHADSAVPKTKTLYLKTLSTKRSEIRGKGDVSKRFEMRRTSAKL